MTGQFHKVVPYQTLWQKKKFLWPENKKIAIYFALNVENYTLNSKHGHSYTQGGRIPDVRNYTWREFGLRIGFWRIIDLFKKHQIPLSHLINSEILRHYPQIVKYYNEDKPTILAHGQSNAVHPLDHSEEEEKSAINNTINDFKTFLNLSPKGWLSPWIESKLQTLDYLFKNDIKYTLDYLMDTCPTNIKTLKGKDFVSIPYSLELNDTPNILSRKYSIEQYEKSLYLNLLSNIELSRNETIVMAIPLHTFVAGNSAFIHILDKFLSFILKKENTKHLWYADTDRIFDHYIKLKMSSDL